MILIKPVVFRTLFLFLGMAILAAFLPHPAVFADKRGPISPFCKEYVEKWYVLKKKKRRFKKLLLRNQNYMKKLGPEDTSKKIKISSNILIISIKTESIQNLLLALKKKINSPKCRRHSSSSQDSESSENSPNSPNSEEKVSDETKQEP